MKALLDTHVLLWWLEDSKLLKKSAREILSDSSNIIYVSAASIWEIAIKESSGKISVPKNFMSMVIEEGFHPLSIKLEHAERSGKLPKIHADPFDRMLVAQATVEQLALLTHDEILAQYPCDTILV